MSFNIVYLHFINEDRQEKDYFYWYNEKIADERINLDKRI